VFEEACASCGHGDRHVHATGLTASP
jgi:hypothetical protein